MKKVNRKKNAVSTFLAALILMILAVSAGVVIWAYTMGYVGNFPGALDGGNREFMIESVAQVDTGDLWIYVKNTGKGSVKLDPDTHARLYVNDVDTDYTLDPDEGNDGLAEGKICTVIVANSALNPAWAGKTVDIKVIADDGTFVKTLFKLASQSGGGMASPTLSTTPPSGAVVGVVFTDSATLTGATSDAGGTVTYTLYSGTYPGTPVDSPSTVTVTNGVVLDSDTFTVASAGNYYFLAVYSGDAKNNGDTSDAELFTVGAAGSTTTTLLSQTPITLGESVTDEATVSVTTGPGATGTVDFEVSTDGATWNKYGETKTLSGGKATSDPYAPLAAGSCRFRVKYSGDSNYASSQSGDNDEPLTVNKATTTTATLLSASSITLGESVTDTVTVTGLGGSYPAPTGDVEFYWSTDHTTWNKFDTETLPTVLSDSYQPLSAGTYWFKAVYMGDSNYLGSESGETAEELTVNPALAVIVDSFAITAPSGSTGGTVSTGETFTVTAQIKLSSGSATVSATITPPAGYTVTPPNPLSQSVGTTDVAFAWTVTAPSSSSASAQISLSATAPTYTTGTDSLDVVTVTAASLTSGSSISASPSSLNVGETITVTMTVHNSGTASAITVTPSALTLGGTGSATLALGPTPASATIIGDDSQGFIWTYTATGAGTVTFSGSASGSDQYSGAAVSTGPLGPSTEVTVNAAQYLVTFSQTGIDSSAGTNTVLTVGTTDYAYNALPSSVYVDAGTTFSWASTVGGGAGKQFVKTGESGSSPISAGGTYSATYKTQHYLTVTSVHDSPTLTSGWYDAGSQTVSVTSPVDESGTRYRCTGWTGTGSVPASGSTNTVTFTLDAASNITWNWVAQYDLKFGQSGLDSTAQGTIVSVTVGANPAVNVVYTDFTKDFGYVDSGTTIAYTFTSTVASSTSGKQFVLTTPAPSPASGFTLGGATTVTGTYNTQYYITVTSAHDTPTASAWVTAGQDFATSVTSPADVVANDNRWICTGYSIDGGGSVAGTSYTFINVQAKHTIVYNWDHQFWITVTSAHDTPTASAWVTAGQNYATSVTSPDGSWICTGYAIDGGGAVAGTSYTFTNVQAKHTIVYNWAVWVTPTGDSGASWSNRGNAHDGSTTTYAYDDIGSNSWSDWLVLSYSSTTGTKIRYWVTREDTNIDNMEIAVWNTAGAGSWDLVYSGNPTTFGQWVEVTFTSKTTTQMRIRFYNNRDHSSRQANVYEMAVLSGG